MQPGQVIGGRFVIGSITRPGDITEVVQAQDRSSGAMVALKVLLQGQARDRVRFEREARALSELRHPGIVRYVHHGVTPSGEPYLATEWLDGEDLECRLRRDKLAIDESLLLVSRAAEALSVAHMRGVIHRDLKPSNLFLVEGKLDQVKLLDFGMARFRGGMKMTQTGTLLGSPGYMAPEQARGGIELTPRVDVFALGCVLFECLTGEPAFGNEHLMGLIGNLLFEEPPRVVGFRPEVPEELDALVAQMLSKDPQQRPRDGAAVVETIAALERRIFAVPSEPPASMPHRSLSGAERRLIAVLMIGPQPSPGHDAQAASEPQDPESAGDALRQAVHAREGRLVVLRDGSLRATMRGAGIATDHAVHAARTALALRSITPLSKIALSMSLTEVSGPRALTEAIDRAAGWIATRGWAPAPRETKIADQARPIAIEEPVARLLDPSFEVAQGPGRFDLYTEQIPSDEGSMRLVLGQPSITVGREREMGVLRGLFEECVEESIAHAVLVTAPPGVGKSRLVLDFVREIRASSQPAEILFGRCDSLQVGPTPSLLGQMLRNACGIREGDSLETRQEKLRARIGRHLAAQDHPWVCEFLAELAGIPMPSEASDRLQAAREDREHMDEHIQKAWETFLRWECAIGPVLIVFENLHGADLQTVRLIDEALRNLHHEPWMLVCAARPEVHDVFPKLWTDRGIEEMRLSLLPRRTSERLVRHALGESTPQQTVQRIVQQAGGHPFYLEELVRAEAEGKGETLPETVLWMAQTKLATLGREARQVLRAASVFGEVFWQGGVASLLGGGLRYIQMGHLLTDLVTREVLARRPESHVPNEPEFCFETPTLHQAVYATLTCDDRRLGHQVAADWLERHGQHDAAVIEKHREHGREPQ